MIYHLFFAILNVLKFRWKQAYSLVKFSKKHDDTLLAHTNIRSAVKLQFGVKIAA